MKKKIFIFLFICLFTLKLTIVLAQRTIYIDIQGPGEKRINVFVSKFIPINDKNESTPESLKFFREILLKNFSFLPFINLMSHDSILGGGDIERYSSGAIDFNKFSLSKVDMVVVLGWKREGESLFIEIKVFDVYTQQMIIGKGYVFESALVYSIANRFCSHFMKKLCGVSGFFDSFLAVIVKNKTLREVYVCTPQGYNWQRITNTKGICLSPSWSWDNNLIAYTVINNNSYQLWTYNINNNSFKQVLVPGNTIISPVFTPQGDLAVAIDPSGNPDIYLIRNGKVVKSLVKGWGIDISPSFNRDGDKMVFVSSRLGSPQIFLLDLNNNRIIRISYEGNYNTAASISPDGRFVAYTRMIEKGHRIFLYDLKTGEEKQLTFGPGNDEHPTWGPDSFFLAFTSNRSGKYKIYITTRLGNKPIAIHQSVEGEVISPSWSK